MKIQVVRNLLNSAIDKLRNLYFDFCSFENVEFLFYEQTKYKEIANALNIKFWTTIVVYKGQNEIVRKIGLVKKEDIYQLIKKGI